MSDRPQNEDWHCGGWDGAQRETLRQMAKLSFQEKIAWLEQAQDAIATMHGEEAALLPSGSIIPTKRKPVVSK